MISGSRGHCIIRLPLLTRIKTPVIGLIGTADGELAASSPMVPHSDLSGPQVDRFSRGFGERVLEVVRMLSVSDLDCHLARKTHQLIGARVRHHCDA